MNSHQCEQNEYDDDLCELKVIVVKTFFLDLLLLLSSETVLLEDDLRGYDIQRTELFMTVTFINYNQRTLEGEGLITPPELEGQSVMKLG